MKHCSTSRFSSVFDLHLSAGRDRKNHAGGSGNDQIQILIYPAMSVKAHLAGDARLPPYQKVVPKINLNR
jgi:hypothetical protein